MDNLTYDALDSKSGNDDTYLSISMTQQFFGYWPEIADESKWAKWSQEQWFAKVFEKKNCSCCGIGCGDISDNLHCINRTVRCYL